MKNEQVEWDKCKNDLIYFCKKYIKINNIDGGHIDFPADTHQISLLKAINKNRLLLGILPRQVFGKTTCSLIYALHQSMFDNKTVFLGEVKQHILKDKLRDLHGMYDSLPVWMRLIADKEKVIGRFSFPGGGKVIGSSIDPNAIRGTTIHIAILDEFAFVPDLIANKFSASIFPCMASSSTSQLIILSSPNGKNHFYDMYMNSKINNFKIFKKTIHDADTNRYNQTWITEQINMMGKDAFDQSYLSKFN